MVASSLKIAAAAGAAAAGAAIMVYYRMHRKAAPARILIAGGGIGGLATALFIEEQLGDAVEVLVFERSRARTSERSRGSGVGINAEGYRILTHLCGDRIPFGPALPRQPSSGWHRQYVCLHV